MYYKKITSVLGIGNALVDVINLLEDDSFLDMFGLPRGSMTLVDTGISRQIYDATLNSRRQITTGGSAANTIYTLAELGTSCGYLGKIGMDSLGDTFRQEFERKKIKTHLLMSEKDTGRVMALVSPDSERTMATYLGAAADLKPEDLTPKMFSGYSLLYIEGYLVQDHRLIETAVDLARQNGLIIAIDLSSYNVVEQNLTFLKELITGKVDIVFANEEEALAFTGKAPEEAVGALASICEVAVVKVGKVGSLIQQANEIIEVGAIKTVPVDTTGAGDNYAAGFLFGLSKGYSLEKCGRIAAFVAGKVVEVVGAKIPEKQWPEIRRELERLEG